MESWLHWGQVVTPAWGSTSPVCVFEMTEFDTSLLCICKLFLLLPNIICHYSTSGVLLSIYHGLWPWCKLGYSLYFLAILKSSYEHILIYIVRNIHFFFSVVVLTLRQTLRYPLVTFANIFFPLARLWLTLIDNYVFKLIFIFVLKAVAHVLSVISGLYF